MTLKVEQVLYHGRSDFQDVLVFKSSTYGNVLVLDGVIQLTERDEHAYQEMITHVPLHSHPDPQSVLIVGGGDGGVLREVCRHPGVQQVTMCEIDKMVVEVSRKYFGSSTATSYDDPRVTLVHDDAAVFVQKHHNEYDVVIVDSSDPVGPAETLFTSSFYKALSVAMRPGAIMCNQGECIWLHLDLIGECMRSCTEVFPSVDYCYTTIPTYPSGQIGFFVCSTAPNKSFRLPCRLPAPPLEEKLKYYSPATHAAAFVLPRFAENAITNVRRPAAKYVCLSTPPPLITRGGLLLAAVGAALGAAAVMAALPRK